MQKIDITVNTLYINKMISVIKSKMTSFHKPNLVKDRHCDALIFILNGSCTYKFDDGCEFTVAKGDILYLAHHAVYTMYIHTDDYTVIFCDFEFDCDKKRLCGVFTPKLSLEAENSFYKLLNAYKHPSKHSFTECLSTLYTIYGIVLKSATREYTNQITKSKAEDIKRCIDSSFRDAEFSISTLSENIGISEVYLRKLFKAQYGISPSHYISSVRINNAKSLMIYPFISLEECALQSGFTTLQYFCRVFKKEMGITPGKYRKKLGD